MPETKKAPSNHIESRKLSEIFNGVKVIIFDFDGTIAHSLELTVKFFNQVAEEFNLPKITDSLLKELRTLSAREIFKRSELSLWQLGKLVRIIQKDLKDNITSIKVVDGIPEVIARLKKMGFQVGVLTSNTSENVQLFLDHHQIGQIDFIYTGKSIFGKHKTLRKILARNELNANEVLYIGDEVRDIEAAKKVGTRSVAVTWGLNSTEKLETAEPSGLVNKVEELKSALVESNKTEVVDAVDI